MTCFACFARFGLGCPSYFRRHGIQNHKPHRLTGHRRQRTPDTIQFRTKNGQATTANTTPYPNARPASSGNRLLTGITEQRPKRRIRGIARSKNGASASAGYLPQAASPAP